MRCPSFGEVLRSKKTRSFGEAGKGWGDFRLYGGKLMDKLQSNFLEWIAITMRRIWFRRSDFFL